MAAILGPAWTPPRWEEVEKWATAEIETLRTRLESKQSEELTLQTRGEIYALRRLLAIGQPPAPEDPRKKIQPAQIDY